MKSRGIEEEEAGLNRRGFLKGAAVAGLAGFFGAAAFGTVRSLIAPEVAVEGELLDTFVYIRPDGARLDQWYVEEDLVFEEVRLSHFDVFQGAPVLWRAIRDAEGRVIPVGFPGLIVRWDEEELTFPDGYDRDMFVIEGLYAVFNCCTHACCKPGWQLMPRSSQDRDLGRDTVYCACHFSQYDPRIIDVYRHPGPPESTGATYIGIHKIPGVGPADRGMPLVPIELDGDKVVGRARNPEWYLYLDHKGDMAQLQEAG